MNNWHLEVMAELHRKQILGAMRQIRLEQEAQKGNSFQPGRFARGMVSVSLWMIAFGEQLHKRYAGPWTEVQPTRHNFSANSR